MLSVTGINRFYYLRANFLQELKSEEEQKSCYMREALNYFHKFWKEPFTYIKDGRYQNLNNQR